MSAIDWTRPIRTSGGKHPARVVGIDPHREWPVEVEVVEPGPSTYRRFVDRHGVARGEGDLVLIENAPLPAQIVERFGYAYPCGPATYAVYAHQLLTSREAADEARRRIKGPTYLVRVHIEVQP